MCSPRGSTKPSLPYIPPGPCASIQPVQSRPTLVLECSLSSKTEPRAYVIFTLCKEVKGLCRIRPSAGFLWTEKIGCGWQKSRDPAKQPSRRKTTHTARTNRNGRSTSPEQNSAPVQGIQRNTSQCRLAWNHHQTFQWGETFPKKRKNNTGNYHVILGMYHGNPGKSVFK